MDIRKFSVQETARLHLRDANDQLLYDNGDNSKPVIVILHGPGSQVYAKAQAAQNNRMLDLLKNKGKVSQTAEQKTHETAEFLADCTAGFENLEYENLTGGSLARAVYADISIGFVAEQVTRFIGDWANFTKPSTKG